MKKLKSINTNEFLQRLVYKEGQSIIDFSNLDLQNIDTRDKLVKNAISNITSLAANSYGENIFCLDFSSSNISGLDFSNYNLTSVVLTGITAINTIFVNSNFSDVRIDEADVIRADFRNTDLSYTKFFNTKIDGANFASANLQKTYGLMLNGSVDEIVARMGVVSSIKDAIFPDNAKKMTILVENEIDKRNPQKMGDKNNIAKQKIISPIKENFIFDDDGYHQW